MTVNREACPPQSYNIKKETKLTKEFYSLSDRDQLRIENLKSTTTTAQARTPHRFDGSIEPPFVGHFDFFFHRQWTPLVWRLF